MAATAVTRRRRRTAAAVLAAWAAVFATFGILLLPHTGEAFVPNDARAMAVGAARRSKLAPPSLSPFDSSTIATIASPASSVGSISPTTVVLRMGLFDWLRGERNDDDDDEADFVKLRDMSKNFLGPGPVVLLYQVPNGIDDDEVRDILSDTAPKATSQGISMARIAPMVESTASRSKSYSLETSESNNNDDDDGFDSNAFLVELSLEEALKTVINRPPTTIPPPPQQLPTPAMEGSSPVVIFSGFLNTEMMDSYNILGEEVYKEASSSYGRGQYLACATAVPNAMNKPLKQVLMEISGDHAEAMRPPPKD